MYYIRWKAKKCKTPNAETENGYKGIEGTKRDTRKRKIENIEVSN